MTTEISWVTYMKRARTSAFLWLEKWFISNTKLWMYSSWKQAAWCFETWCGHLSRELRAEPNKKKLFSFHCDGSWHIAEKIVVLFIISSLGKYILITKSTEEPNSNIQKKKAFLFRRSLWAHWSGGKTCGNQK